MSCGPVSVPAAGGESETDVWSLGKASLGLAIGERWVAVLSPFFCPLKFSELNLKIIVTQMNEQLTKINTSPQRQPQPWEPALKLRDLDTDRPF